MRHCAAIDTRATKCPDKSCPRMHFAHGAVCCQEDKQAIHLITCSYMINVNNKHWTEVGPGCTTALIYIPCRQSLKHFTIPFPWWTLAPRSYDSSQEGRKWYEYRHKPGTLCIYHAIRRMYISQPHVPYLPEVRNSSP